MAYLLGCILVIPVLILGFIITIARLIFNVTIGLIGVFIGIVASVFGKN